MCAVCIDMSLKRASSCVSGVPKIKKIRSVSLLEIEQSGNDEVTSSRIDKPDEGGKFVACIVPSAACVIRFVSSRSCR